MSLTIRVNGIENPFADLVTSFFAQVFPGANNSTAETVLEAVTAAFVSSNQVRYGPSPNPESLVEIREVIRKSIANSQPIPVLTPFGSRKMRLNGQLDVAEIAALKQLDCLQRRVTTYYAPGIITNIRLEDASGHYLFADEGEASRVATEKYCDDFGKLVRILGYNTFIHPVLESTLFDEREYATTCDSIVPALMGYILDTDQFGFEGYHEREPWKVLSAFGWQGNIPQEQRDFYRHRYGVLYPGISAYDATMKLVRYFAGSWARIKHNGTGADKSWGTEYIRVTYVTPIPGAPQGLTTRNIHYRTLPLKFAATHIPAWRCKGYLKISDREVTPKIASWSEVCEYQQNSILFRNGTEEVTVQADYVLY